MGRHRSIFGDIKKAFHDVEHKVEHSPIIASVIHDTKDAAKAVVHTVSDPQFQKDFGTGFKMGEDFAMKTVVPIALPGMSAAMELVQSGPSMLSSVTGSVGDTISGVTGGLTNPLGSIMTYAPIIGGVVGLLVLYKLMKKK